ncbi:MAG: arylsulfatase [Bryobacterales bacterium]|nr:arylsulfatase [Bryobacterales bacterium]
MPALFDRRQFLQAAAGASMAACTKAPQEEAAPRPNIVMIMADDMGYSDIGCYGGEIPTPNLDRLGHGGMRFTNHHTNNMCVPTRAALMSGVQSDVSVQKGVLHPRVATVAQSLNDAGYHTLMSGKWHLAKSLDDKPNMPCHKGFDRYYGMLFGAADYWQVYGLMRDDESVMEECEREDFYLTDAISDNAVSFLKDAEGRDEPVFLYLAYTAAHWPLHAREADIARHEGKYAGGWDALRQQRHARMKELGVVNPEWPLSPRNAEVPAWEDEPHKEWQQRRMEVYAAQVEVMDQGIGRVLAELERQGRLDNTLVCFQIDNGGCHVEYTPDRKGDFLFETTRDGRPITPGNLPEIMPGPEGTFQSYGHGWANASNTPFRMYKQYDHEGGIRTPLIAHWPGVIEPGSKSDALSHVVDLAPTFLDAAGAVHPAEALPHDGASLLSVMRGGDREAPPTLYWQWSHGRALRQGQWKIVAMDKGPWELYDLAADGTELNDLAAQMPERVAQMEAEWQRWNARSEQL